MFIGIGRWNHLHPSRDCRPWPVGAQCFYREPHAPPIVLSMVDIHSHVLPGLDDGAPNMEAALEMLHVAGESGTTDIVATPHANPQYRFDPMRVEVALAALQKAAGSGPRIHYGCELHLTPENIEDA